MAGSRVGPFQEADGSISMRRILAAFFAIASVALGWRGIGASGAWTVFIPSLGSMVASLLCLFFTTWEAISTLAATIKGK